MLLLSIRRIKQRFVLDSNWVFLILVLLKIFHQSSMLQRAWVLDFRPREQALGAHRLSVALDAIRKRSTVFHDCARLWKHSCVTSCGACHVNVL